MIVKKLPVFNKYVVDFKLNQFRKIDKNKLKIIEFNSKKGQQLLKQLYQKGYSKPPMILDKSNKVIKYLHE